MLTLSTNRIWAFLLAATAVTYWLGESGLAGHAGMAPILAMFALAFIKGFLVILDFMDLRHAPPLWRRLLVGWLVFVVSMIVLAYWIGLPGPGSVGA
ncbi:MAG: cytochrome C oxidase subunit IV family protein [Pseudomonadota bacterium]